MRNSISRPGQSRISSNPLPRRASEAKDSRNHSRPPVIRVASAGKVPSGVRGACPLSNRRALKQFSMGCRLREPTCHSTGRASNRYRKGPNLREPNGYPTATAPNHPGKGPNLREPDPLPNDHSPNQDTKRPQSARNRPLLTPQRHGGVVTMARSQHNAASTLPDARVGNQPSISSRATPLVSFMNFNTKKKDTKAKKANSP